MFVNLAEHSDDLQRMHDKHTKAVQAHQKLSDVVRDQGDNIHSINLTLEAVNSRAGYLEQQVSESNVQIRGNLAETDLNMAKLSDKMDKHMDGMRGGLKVNNAAAAACHTLVCCCCCTLPHARLLLLLQLRFLFPFPVCGLSSS